MKKLLCLRGGAMLAFNAQSPKIEIPPFDICDRIPDLALTPVINYKDSVASLSSFGNKLIILDFWTTHCGSCITKFPQEEAFQKANKGRLQFSLVTFEGTPKVYKFFHTWDSTYHMHLSMPIVTHDRYYGGYLSFNTYRITYGFPRMGRYWPKPVINLLIRQPLQIA